MLFLRDLIAKATRDVEAVAFAVTRGLPSESPVTYVAEQRAIAFELHLMEQGEYSVPVSDDVFLLLRSTYYKILDTITRIGQMHAATRSSPERLPAIDMALFVSRPRIDWKLLQHNLNLQSPIFRYALRISLAMVAALLCTSMVMAAPQTTPKRGLSPIDRKSCWNCWLPRNGSKASFMMARPKKTNPRPRIT